MIKTMKAGLIYKARGGHVYDLEEDKYDCYTPAEYADGCILGDCWVVDEAGNINPGYNNSPVPVRVGQLGEVVGCIHHQSIHEDAEDIDGSFMI